MAQTVSHRTESMGWMDMDLVDKWRSRMDIIQVVGRDKVRGSLHGAVLSASTLIIVIDVLISQYSYGVIAVVVLVLWMSLSSTSPSIRLRLECGSFSEPGSKDVSSSQWKSSVWAYSHPPPGLK